MCEKQRTSTFSPPPQSEEAAAFDPALLTRGPSQEWWLGPLHQVSAMTSADSLSLILRRLDEIERKNAS